MARRKSSKCPEPLNTMIDIAGAITMGLFARSKIKRDFEKGEGEESARAAAMVFGLGSMHKGSRGIMNLGGLIGLNSGLKSIAKKHTQYIAEPKYINKISEPPKKQTPVRKNMWREYCEDGTPYGIDPNDFSSADEYADALNNAKRKEDLNSISNINIAKSENNLDFNDNKHLWRKYCESGIEYGINPEDYDTADDYEEALLKAKADKNGSKR